MGEMGKRSWDIKKVLNPREQKMASELKQLAGLQKRRRPNKNKSKQRKLAGLQKRRRPSKNKSKQRK